MKYTMMARCPCRAAGTPGHLLYVEKSNTMGETVRMSAVAFKNRIKIKRVSSEFLDDVIEHCTPLGLFLPKEGRRWVAADNSTGDAWTEDFRWKWQAVRWLRGKFEV